MKSDVQETYEVFISYSRRDYVDEHGRPIPGNAVNAIMKALDDAGISFWIDKEGIFSGKEFDEAIMGAILGARILVFVSSANSNASEWTRREIRFADQKGKEIIPIRIDDSPYDDVIELRIGTLQYQDYFKSPEEALERMVKAILKSRQDIERKEERLNAEKAIQDAVIKIKRSMSEQDSAVLDIIYRRRLLGLPLTKSCPVCVDESPLEEKWCPSCGFVFPLLYGLDPKEKRAGKLIDQEYLALYQKLWEKGFRPDKPDEGLVQQIESLKKEKEKLQADVKRLQDLSNQHTVVTPGDNWMDSVSGKIGGYPYIDMGLSVKWAAFNVGAKSPVEAGKYFAWGETAQKADYTWQTYKFREEGSGETDATIRFSKYNPYVDANGYGRIPQLLRGDDVAFKRFGEGWRMPTNEEWKELIENCRADWTPMKDGSGVLILTSRINGNHIVLPAGGRMLDTHCEEEGERGYYWSSTLEHTMPYKAKHIYFDKNDLRRSSSSRYGGQLIRPVSDGDERNSGKKPLVSFLKD